MAPPKSFIKSFTQSRSRIEIIAAQQVTGKVLDEREELAIVMSNVIIVHELLSIFILLASYWRRPASRLGTTKKTQHYRRME